MFSFTLSFRLTGAVMTTLCLVGINYSLYAQYCPEQTEIGSTVEVWDWRQPNYNFFLGDDDDLVNRHVEVNSPFNPVPGTISPNTTYINFVNDAPDYDPDNGWELLYKLFGSDNADDPDLAPAPVSTASFALYNRYTGMVRVFFYIINENDAYNVATVSSNHLGAPLEDGSAIYSLVEDIRTPLADYVPTAGDGFANFNVLERGPVWTVLDFPAAFDPCVCNGLSMMRFKATTDAITNVNLIADGTSQTIPIYSDGSSPEGLLASGARINDGIAKGFKRYKDYSDFLGSIGGGGGDDGDDGDDGGSSISEKKNSFVSSFKFLPIVGGILETLNFFFGGKKTSPTVIAYNTNYNLEITGTEVFTNTDSETGYLTPGAEAPNPASILANYKPVYDNPLGVFTLLNNPVVEFSEYEYETGNSEDYSIVVERSYKFDVSSINYVVNTVAGLEAIPVSIQAALQFSNCEEGAGGESDNIEQGDFLIDLGLTPNDDDFNTYNTPMLNLGCLEQYAIKTEYKYDLIRNPNSNEYEEEEKGAYCDKVQLVLLVALARVDGEEDEEIVLNLTYDVDLVAAPYDVNDIPANPYLGMDIEDINDSCEDIISPVSDMTLANFCENDYAPELFDFRTFDEDELENRLKQLENYVPNTTGTIIKDPNDSFDGGKRAQANSNGVLPHSTLMNVFPNPSDGTIRVSPPNVVAKVGTLTVLDLTGRKISASQVTLTEPFDVNLRSLAPGIYVVLLQDNQGNQLGSERLVIK